MVVGSTIIAVRKAHLELGQTYLTVIADRVQMERNTVREALAVLEVLGLSEKVEHDPAPSKKKNGWVTVEYRPVLLQSKAASSAAIGNEA